MAEVRKVAESVFSKPADWPRNQRELAVDSVDRAYAAFMANPNARTREVLVATSSVFDYNRLGSRGAYRISAYEIRLLNTFWFCAKYYNFSSLLMFVYLVVAELSMMDRMIGIMSEGLQKDGMKYPPDDWQNYQYLHKPLWAYYMAYQDYRARKEGDFGSSIICVINQALEGVEDPCVAFDITKSLVVLISDMSCMLGWRREGMMRLSRKELSCLLAFEADLLRKTHQRPGERPLSSQLMIQISNYILKSRHGYNDDYICKYMWPENVCRALENGQVWMHDIETLNDPMEGRVIDELFGDSTWLGYEWAKDIDTRASRTYYVASFSKSMRNEEAAGRYGGCVFGYKGDRLVDMLAPIGDMTMYRREDANPTLPETRVHTSLTQVVAFDVLYDKDELKSELRYLCEIIDLFEMTSDEKRRFQN